MLKGTRAAILRKIQPISVHGQISWDLLFNDIEDPEGPPHVARISPNAVDREIEPGDRIQLEYVAGAVVSVRRVKTVRASRTRSRRRPPH